MSLIHRRIFYAKVGAANELVQLMHDDNSAMARFGSAINSRILTDHMTGRSDRVVMEWEADDTCPMDAAMNQVMANPEGADFFGGWMEKLNTLIHYSEGELWDVR